MSTYTSSLLVNPTDSFNTWRLRYNQMVEGQVLPSTVGTLSALASGIVNRGSLVDAVNYVYSIRVSEGQPLENSTLTNCNVPETSKLNFGTSYISYVDDKFQFSIGGTTPAFFVNSDGYVGVGTDATLESMLQVAGTGQFNQVKVKNLSTGKTVTTSSESISSLDHNIIDSDAPLVINKSSSNLMMNTGGGKVGIGSITNAQLLELVNLRTGDTGLGYRMDTPSMTFRFRVDPVGYTIYDHDVNRFRIYSDGNVGVGVEVPTYKMHVNGTTFGTQVYFGSKLWAGSNTFVTVTDAGQTNVTITSGGSLVHGTTTIVDTDSKVPVGSIKGLTTTAVSEGTSQYFTSARAITAVSGGTLTSATIAGTGTLVHGSTTIIGADSKIPASVIKNLTSDVTTEGSTNLYFTSARAVTAVQNNPLTQITLTNLLNLPPFTTALRPTAGLSVGSVIFDTTLGLPIFYAGSSVWKNFAGTTV